MKTYRVSIAAKLPANFEVEVKASSPEAAYNKALEAHDVGKGEYQEILDKPELMPGKPDMGEHPCRAPYVYIAEITKAGEEKEA